MDHANSDSSVAASTRTGGSRSHSDDFKRDAVRLITDENYKFKAAAKAVGVSEKSLRDWHKRLTPPPVACGDDDSINELQEENKRLQKQLRRAEMEREILKKRRQEKKRVRTIYLTCEATLLRFRGCLVPCTPLMTV